MCCAESVPRWVPIQPLQLSRHTEPLGGPLGAEGGRGVHPSFAPSEASPAERALAVPDGAWGAGPDSGWLCCPLPDPHRLGGHAVHSWLPGMPPPPSGEGVPGLGGLKAEQRVRAPTLTLTLTLPAWGPFWSQRKLMTPHTPTQGSALAPAGGGPRPTASRREPGASEWLQGRGETRTKPNRSQDKQNLS